ncbi:MAG: GNAT family N-acetyltransferase [Synechococcales cyanobacterium RM1_1_8]|nr:GNAT family N-acetyltransferase [Synechococcales cyanobacterium RM1_1_8]
MGFWKSLFTGSNAATKGSRAGDAGLLDSRLIEVLPFQGENGSRLYFSMERQIDLYELEELCDAVGWSRRPLRKVKKAIAHSFLVITLWEELGNRRRLIGFSRATSDHAFNATIWDVVVSPKYQGKGLGKSLMKQMIKKLRAEDISNITLFADPQVVSFYQTLGFVVDPEGIKGMFWYPE